MMESDDARARDSAMRLLAEWRSIADAAIEELGSCGGVTYATEQGAPRALPQVQILSTATSRIVQLEDRLGIHAGCPEVSGAAPGTGDELRVVLGMREDSKRAAGG